MTSRGSDFPRPLRVALQQGDPLSSVQKSTAIHAGRVRRCRPCHFFKIRRIARNRANPIVLEFGQTSRHFVCDPFGTHNLHFEAICPHELAGVLKGHLLCGNHTLSTVWRILIMAFQNLLQHTRRCNTYGKVCSLIAIIRLRPMAWLIAHWDSVIARGSCSSEFTNGQPKTLTKHWSAFFFHFFRT